MGTNYYLRNGEYVTFHEDFRACLTTLPSPAKLHIGKSSYGWCFSLRVHPTLGLNSLQDWLQYIPPMLNDGWVLENEYRQVVTMEKLFVTITERSHPDRTWESDLGPYTEPGPDGLCRHKIDGKHCVGHGPGTWDLIIGEFS